MDEKLLDRCNLQIANEAVVRKAGFLQFEEMIKLGALFYTSRGLKADAEKIKECKKILKSSAGIFSNFRGNLGYAIVIKMSLAENPQTYINDVMAIYKKLVEGRLLPGEILTMAAITIYEQTRRQDIDAVIAKTRETYDRIKKDHKFLTDENDMSFIALMTMSGMDVESAANEVETIFRALKDSLKIPSDSAQSVAMVLAMSSRPAQQKVDDFRDLYQALKEEKHATNRKKAIAIYAAFTDLLIPRDVIIPEIAETDAWLKNQKGYGLFSLDSNVRKILAATLVLQYHEANCSSALSTETTSVVAQVVAEEVIFTVIMIITMSIIISSTNHS